jgi:hypothetical protein
VSRSCGLAPRANAAWAGTDPVVAGAAGSTGAAAMPVAAAARGSARIDRGVVTGKAKSLSTPDAGPCPSVVAPEKPGALPVIGLGAVSPAPLPGGGASAGGDRCSGDTDGTVSEGAGGSDPSGSWNRSSARRKAPSTIRITLMKRKTDLIRDPMRWTSVGRDLPMGVGAAL